MLYLVFLRRPRSSDDSRHDPFWEFGSFGRTGCHSRNLFHSKRTPLQRGDRLAFLQGGSGEVRMVGLTPAITVRHVGNRLEARWSASYRPFRYDDAPLFINNRGRSAFPSVPLALRGTARSTYCGAAASRFRSRTKPLPAALADQVLSVFVAHVGARAANYLEAVARADSTWLIECKRRGLGKRYERRRQFERLAQRTLIGMLPQRGRGC